MADLTQVELPNGNTYDLISKTTKGVVRATMDSTSTSTAFTATADGVTALYDGLTILLKNTVVASASGCTLNLNGLGAKSILASLNSGTITTQWALNSTYMFMYNATEDKWEIYQGYNTDDVYTNRPYYYRLTTTVNGIKQYSLFLRTANGLYSSITTNSGTGNKTFSTTTYFDFTKVLYFNGSSNIAAGSMVANNTVAFSASSVNTRYSASKVTTTDTSSLEANKPVYMVFNKPTVTEIIANGTPYVATLASVSTAGPYTQDPFSVEYAANYIYVYLGMMRDTYRMELVLQNTAYMIQGSTLVPYYPDYIPESGTAASATDATYTLYLGTPLVCDANDTASVANNTNVVVSSFNIGSKTPGKYIIIASIKYPAGSSSSNQWRYSQISTSSGATDDPISTQFLDNISMPGNSQYVAHLMGMVDTASVSTVYLKAWHNLGASVTVSYCMQIIRIGNSSGS